MHRPSHGGWGQGMRGRWGYRAASPTHTTHTPGHTPPGPLQDMRALLAHGAHTHHASQAHGGRRPHTKWGSLHNQGPGHWAYATAGGTEATRDVTCNAHTRDLGRERRERCREKERQAQTEKNCAGSRRGRLSGVEKQHLTTAAVLLRHHQHTALLHPGVLHCTGYLALKCP